jgi:hypothetical protein
MKGVINGFRYYWVTFIISVFSTLTLKGLPFPFGGGGGVKELKDKAQGTLTSLDTTIFLVKILVIVVLVAVIVWITYKLIKFFKNRK